MRENDTFPFLPLREPTFFILLSLFPGEKHGYAILKEVEQISQKRVELSTGTLYEALARLLEQGLIERSEDGRAPGPGKPRKLYRLTGLGRRVVEAEAERLAQLSNAAHRQMRDQRAGG
ncbi:MAG TPA: PadR family transcriptional regulator [Anaerolineaceae bacterium]